MHLILRRRPPFFTKAAHRSEISHQHGGNSGKQRHPAETSLHYAMQNSVDGDTDGTRKNADRERGSPHGTSRRFVVPTQQPTNGQTPALFPQSENSRSTRLWSTTPIVPIGRFQETVTSRSSAQDSAGQPLEHHCDDLLRKTSQPRATARRRPTQRMLMSAQSRIDH